MGFHMCKQDRRLGQIQLWNNKSIAFSAGFYPVCINWELKDFS